ncbi:relaxase/mobilization nuclease domain-containing protein [Pseudooceanicola marinus]|uniref:relaxase/mobilization nuclease domain-containing protein n=1 Tax=Pseudooceanicola marinus TaxID=396013 RepID=UPI001CD27CE5|nr:relaxase/mobilization nuclease domain-containing protein [Pseudooceanicola marinus]MCA1337957.1 relaxase/mobilization nuclease domain-containing protein [Pseudooceanicola marinus]
MSDFKSELGFQDCWDSEANRKLNKPAAGSVDSGGRKRKAGAQDADRSTAQAQAISAADKARLARIVKGAPEVMVKVSKPAKNDKSGNPIKVSRASEAVRASEHLAYISRNGKIEVENDRGEAFNGRTQVGAIYREWIEKHDEDRREGSATDRTRITTSIVFSMPGTANAEAVKDAVRALARQEFQGRHDYAMALHTDTHHPHVHLTLRTVGEDGEKLNLRKADLQRLRDTFAEKLRTRGIEAESTPRHARGVTRRGEVTPVYKIRQRGGKPLADARKMRQVRRDLEDNGGRLPQKAWDDALIARRNRVMATYDQAATILAGSADPNDRDLARETKRFAARLTETTTQRAEMARSLAGQDAARSAPRERGKPTDSAERQQDLSKGSPDRGGRQR